MAKVKTDRNRKIVEMYDDRSKRLSFGSIAKIFQLTQPRVVQIYHEEKARQEKEAMVNTVSEK